MRARSVKVGIVALAMAVLGACSEEDERMEALDSAPADPMPAAAEPTPMCEDDIDVLTSSSGEHEIGLYGQHVVLNPVSGRPAAGYFGVVAKTENDTLIGVRAPWSGRAEFHTHMHEGGMMSMMEIAGVDLPLNKRHTFGPGGDHIMFFDVDPTTAIGMEVPITLVFEKAGDVETIAKVVSVQDGFDVSSPPQRCANPVPATE